MPDAVEDSAAVHLTFSEIEWLIGVVAGHAEADPGTESHAAATSVGRKLRATQPGE